MAEPKTRPVQPALSATEARSLLAPMLALVQRFARLDEVLVAVELAEGRLAGLGQREAAAMQTVAVLEQQMVEAQESWQQWQDARAQAQAQLLAQAQAQQAVLQSVQADMAEAQQVAADVEAQRRLLDALTTAVEGATTDVARLGGLAREREREADARVQGAEHRLAQVEKRLASLREVVGLADEEA